MKKNRSSDSSVSIKGDVNIGGDGAIGHKAKVVKMTIWNKKEVCIVTLLGVIASLLTIYSFISNQ